MRKYLAHLVWIVPLVAWMTCGVITKIHDNEPIAKGECLKTYTIEHWHKYSPPTTTTHTVMLYKNQAYVVNGTCQSGTISWVDTHSFLYFLGITSLIPWCFLGLVIVATICVLMYILFKYIQGEE